MTLNQKTRELTSATGFIKDASGNIYEGHIYIGKYNTEADFSEATAEEYEFWLLHKDDPVEESEEKPEEEKE